MKTDKLKNIIPNDWLNAIVKHLDLSHIIDIGVSVKKKRLKKIVYPAKDAVFSAFRLTKFYQVKVVIIGQDPYINSGEAHGLAFSTLNESTPPSLINIFREIEHDVANGFYLDQDPNLTRWAKQGVFLINTVLTVDAKDSNSHKKIGWQEFTTAAIKSINLELDNVVFMLWGGQAKEYKKYIDTTKHLILESGHPSPLAANRGYWFGNKHFSKCNKYLAIHNKNTIKW